MGDNKVGTANPIKAERTVINARAAIAPTYTGILAYFIATGREVKIEEYCKFTHKSDHPSIAIYL